jgi:hypothetical protein
MVSGIVCRIGAINDKVGRRKLKPFWLGPQENRLRPPDKDLYGIGPPGRGKGFPAFSLKMNS